MAATRKLQGEWIEKKKKKFFSAGADVVCDRRMDEFFDFRCDFFRLRNVLSNVGHKASAREHFPLVIRLTWTWKCWAFFSRFVARKRSIVESTSFCAIDDLFFLCTANRFNCFFFFFCRSSAAASLLFRHSFGITIRRHSISSDQTSNSIQFSDKRAPNSKCRHQIDEISKFVSIK